ncbi:MAG: hypothetical protein U0168_02645 [Nannocystaceae bacterium]
MPAQRMQPASAHQCAVLEHGGHLGVALELRDHAVALTAHVHAQAAAGRADRDGLATEGEVGGARERVEDLRHGRPRQHLRAEGPHQLLEAQIDVVRDEARTGALALRDRSQAAVERVLAAVVHDHAPQRQGLGARLEAVAHAPGCRCRRDGGHRLATGLAALERLLPRDRGGGHVGAGVLGPVALAAPLVVVEEQRDQWRDHAAFGRDAELEFLVAALLQHHRVGPRQLDAAGPRRGGAGLADGGEQRVHGAQ